jgi:hypothetical protein
MGYMRASDTLCIAYEAEKLTDSNLPPYDRPGSFAGTGDEASPTRSDLSPTELSSVPSLISRRRPQPCRCSPGIPSGR